MPLSANFHANLATFASVSYFSHSEMRRSFDALSPGPTLG